MNELKRFLSYFKEKELELKKIENEINSSKAETHTELCMLDEKYLAINKENEEKKRQVKAFIDIAKNSTSILKEPLEMKEFDKGVLAKLSVRINSYQINDIFATQLYTEASAQYLFLENELNNSDVYKSKEKESIIYELNSKINRKNIDKKRIINGIREVLESDSFKELFSKIEKIKNVYEKQINLKELTEEKEISIGSISFHLPIPVELNNLITWLNIYDSRLETIQIPCFINMKKGGVILAEYSNNTEDEVLNGIRTLFINLGRYFNNQLTQIVFIDPVRMNSSALGCVSSLANGANSFIDKVPTTIDGIRNTLNSIIAKLHKEDDTEAENCKRFFVFHNFPNGYDSTMISQIQQLCVNAKHYGINLILTNNISNKSYYVSDAFSYVKEIAIKIGLENLGFYYSGIDKNNKEFFKWYSAPNYLPEDIEKALVKERKQIDTGNNYESRIGLAFNNQINKGIRRIENIPYAVDKSGNLQYISFEDSDFATFICGASRSGKSTLLHTIITGIINNNHPDDIEIWLVDFKMTEFSQYTKNLPPHIRYVVLDESPELVYDLIDRLTEILIKRQNIFKGKWQKLQDVPPEKYMPALFVIIDEFSVMSQIVADSVANCPENYIIKMQMLLAKGAALGMHFIFSSQGFTDGSRGLNDYAKKQIQQRIAMKTEYDEIKATLDLKSISDDDRAIMEQLPVHHAIMRIPLNSDGNRLSMGKVLYISDYSKQDALISCMKNKYIPVNKFFPNDEDKYIYKQPVIIDGNSYISFYFKEDKISKTIQDNCFNEEITVFLGEPRRLITDYPVVIENGFCENVLLISPNKELDAGTSIVFTIIKSLEVQNIGVEILSSRKNLMCKKIITNKYFGGINTYIGLDDVCDEIHKIRQRIESGHEENKFFVLLGFESLINEMIYSEGVKNYNFSTNNVTVSENRLPKFDMMTKISKYQNGEISLEELRGNQVNPENHGEIQTNEKSESSYDAREDLKFIISQGPKLGYHFLCIFNSVEDFEQSKIDSSSFKHKILFRLPTSNARYLVGSVNAKIVSELEDHSFRYSNGLESISFRPYLHYGLSWDGWELSEEGTVETNEDEEYLL